MGVLFLRCRETGETFLGISADIPADFNSIHAKLGMNCHPNRRLQALWQQYGEAGFEQGIRKSLKYEDPQEDHTRELEQLREQCLTEDPSARKLWK